MFAVQVKYESDSGVNQAEKRKELRGGTTCKNLVVIFSCAAFVGFPNEAMSSFKKILLGEPLEKFWLLPSVGGTDTTSTK